MALETLHGLTDGELLDRLAERQTAMENHNGVIARMTSRLLATPFETEKHHLRHDIKREKNYGAVLFEEVIECRVEAKKRLIN